ncbi:MAG: M1 family metallopeptidase, partial [Deltaproteobacteria bacterium]|nr:M1 family metallopeptidase [Deltaproteobacteria bacterium]
MIARATVAAVAATALSCGPREAPATRTPAPPAAPIAEPTEPTPTGKLPTDVRPLREALELAIDPAAERFGGTATLELELERPRTQIWLHGRGLHVARVEVRSSSGTTPGVWEEVDPPTGVARVTVPAPIHGRVTLAITYDAAYDAQLVGAYRVVRGGEAAVFTKFEAIYARRAFPSFDEPRFKIPFDVTLVAPAKLEVVGNMPVAERAALPDGTQRTRFARTPPLPTYLVAFAVGPFEAQTATVPPSPVRAQPLPIRAVAWRGRGAETAFALAATPALLAEQERYFGIAFPYPKLDLVAVPDFQSGAMENAGAITFRDSALLVDDKLTPFAQRVSILGIIAHEVAHQWFGDLVTMPWWDDLWLNEGFATFLATRTLRAVRPELEAELEAAVDTHDVMYADSLASARRIRQPIESSHDIANAFDGITYDKGAAVLTMLEHHIGAETFRRGVAAYMKQHAHGNATTNDLLAALSSASDTDLAPLAADFLDRPGVPVVTVRTTCEAGAGRILLEQAQWQPVGSGGSSAGATWQLPVCVRAGNGARVDERCTLLEGRTGAIDLPTCVDWVMPNAGATGYYRFAMPPADLARLRDKGAGKLSTVERLSLAHNIEAAFRSGALGGGELILALEAVARDPHGAVASVPLDALRFIDAHVVDGAARAALRARIAAVYAP